jgi:hypothetical protein
MVSAKTRWRSFGSNRRKLRNANNLARRHRGRNHRNLDLNRGKRDIINSRPIRDL